MVQSVLTPIYKVNWYFAVAGLALNAIAMLGIVPLLRRWSKLGRKVSFAPVEVAKAFASPLLPGGNASMDVDEVVSANHGVELVFSTRLAEEEHGLVKRVRTGLHMGENSKWKPTTIDSRTVSVTDGGDANSAKLSTDGSSRSSSTLAPSSPADSNQASPSGSSLAYSPQTTQSPLQLSPAWPGVARYR